MNGILGSFWLVWVRHMDVLLLVWVDVCCINMGINRFSFANFYFFWLDHVNDRIWHIYIYRQMSNQFLQTWQLLLFQVWIFLFWILLWIVLITTAYHSVADWYMVVYWCNKNMLKQMDDRSLTWSSKCCQPAVPVLRLNHAESDSSVCVIVSQGRVWSRPFTKINLNRQQSRKDDWYWGFPLEAQYPSICHLADTFIRWLTIVNACLDPERCKPWGLAATHSAVED